jgi:CHASE3 domain sensor protein
MHFVNSRKKSGFSFSTFFVVLLSIASIAFGTVDSSADSNQNNQVETERFSNTPNFV